MADQANIGVISIKIEGNADKASDSVQKLTGHLGGLKTALAAIGTGAFIAGIKKIGSMIMDSMQKTSNYIQTLQTFKSVMGENYVEAKVFADEMERLLGFDSKGIMDTMSTFQRLGESFGLETGQVNTMSRNLTQLAADMTTTGLSFEEASQKLRSGFAGEIEPMRAFGVALDKVTLQQELYRLGIDRRYDSLTRAQKTELIYHQIMMQTANIQGQVAIQAIAPATAFRLMQTAITSLARAVGSIFIPIFMKIIPVVLAVAKVLERVAKAIASLFGFEIGDFTAGIGDISSGLGGVSDGLDNVGGSAKKATKELQKMLMPFDELNNVNFETGSAGSGGSGIGGVGGGGSLGLPLEDYDLLSKLSKDGVFGNIDALADTLQRNLPQIATAIGLFLMLLGRYKIGGILKMIQGFAEIVMAIKDIIDNGPNFDNITSLFEGLGGFITGLGIFTKNPWILGVGLIIEGLSGIIKQFGDFWRGITTGDWGNFDKAKWIMSVIEITGGIILLLIMWYKKTKKAKDVGGLAKNIDQVSKATQQVDGNVGKLSPKLTSLAKNLGMGILIIAEVIVAVGLIVLAIWGLGLAFQEIIKVWQPVIDNEQTLIDILIRGTGIIALVGLAIYALGKSGTELVKDIGIGLLVLAEIELATALFIGGIWAIGWGLQQILDAWIPVLSYGDLVLAALAAGTGILLAVALATGLLGVLTVATGGLLPLAILVGALMLAEIALAAVEFTLAITAVGLGLQQILYAWIPVLANGDLVLAALIVGTAMLVAIGSATALLGIATVATGGLLPLAIGLGTLMLQQLTGAVMQFVSSLTSVAIQLTLLVPILANLTAMLPGLNNNLNQYINFMKTFAGYIANFAKASAVASLANAINTIIKWFTGNPIQNFANDVNKNYRETSNLNDKLRLAIPELQIALNLLTTYFGFLEALDRITGQNKNYQLATGMFINMQEVGRKLVTGFVDGIRAESWSLNSTIDSVINNAFSAQTAYNYGLNFGYNLANGIGNAMRNSYFPRLHSTVTTDSGTITVRFNAYANGGFPENGEFFLANENGPELIGNIGNRTAVANNDQIVEALAMGVYDATSKALQENNKSQDINPYFEINLGNERLYSGYAKHKNNESNMYGITF